VAGDANIAGQVYPDQSLYPCNSVPALVERINNALQRADQIEHAEGNVKVLFEDPTLFLFVVAVSNGSILACVIGAHLFNKLKKQCIKPQLCSWHFCSKGCG